MQATQLVCARDTRPFAFPAPKLKEKLRCGSRLSGTKASWHYTRTSAGSLATADCSVDVRVHNSPSLGAAINRGSTISPLSIHSGDVNKPDHEGSTALHVAATYGNLDMLELLINKGANLFALDNHGRTAARVAAHYRKMPCCRYLDTLALRWQMQNGPGVLKLQIKAMKDLKKRSRAAATEEPVKRISYDYATAPTGGVLGPSPRAKLLHGKHRHSSASDELPKRKGGKLSQEAALRMNFELRSGEESPVAASRSADQLITKEDHVAVAATAASSAGNTFRDIPKHRTGPLLNNFAQLPLNYEPPEDARHSMLDPFSGATQNSVGSGGGSDTGKNKGSLPELELMAAHPTVTMNESTLATFLHSLDLMDCVQLLHREKLDLDALGMCSEDDLISIGLSLGPRKKILNAIARRKAFIAGAGRMTDTEF